MSIRTILWPSIVATFILTQLVGMGCVHNSSHYTRSLACAAVAIL